MKPQINSANRNPEKNLQNPDFSPFQSTLEDYSIFQLPHRPCSVMKFFISFAEHSNITWWYFFVDFDWNIRRNETQNNFYEPKSTKKMLKLSEEGWKFQKRIEATKILRYKSRRADFDLQFKINTKIFKGSPKEVKFHTSIKKIELLAVN